MRIERFLYQVQASESEHTKRNSKLECTDGIESFNFFLKIVVSLDWNEVAFKFKPANSCIETLELLSLYANLTCLRPQLSSAFCQPSRKLVEVALKNVMKNRALCDIADQREGMSRAGFNESCKSLFELAFPRFSCLYSSNPETVWFFLFDFLSCPNLTLLLCWSDNASQASVGNLQRQMEAEAYVCVVSGKITPCISDICSSKFRVSANIYLPWKGLIHSAQCARNVIISSILVMFD